MKNPNKKYGKLVLMVFAFVFMHNAIAQPPPPFFYPDVDDGAPINDLVAMALAFGAWFGAREIRKRK